MKKIIAAISFGLIGLNSATFGQKMNLSTDSIRIFLCNKWTVDYALVGEMKMGRTSGAVEINCEFKNEKDFIPTMSSVKEKHTANRRFSPDKILITLKPNGKIAWSVISLK